MTQPLHPRGTLRARFAAPARTGADDVFRRLGVGARKCDLGDEGLYLAEELVEADRWLGGTDPEALALLVIALMIAQRQGSTRLPLGPKGPLKALVADIARVAGLDTNIARTMKTITELTATLGFSSMVGAGDARRPLVVDDGCIYTERSRRLEVRVAAKLAERLAGASGLGPRASARDVLADLHARPAGIPLSEEQQKAVAVVLDGRLSVVTGGPGTGKTLVTASIVRAFARMGITHVALAAQTGKAANRMTTVIAEQLAAIGDPSDEDRALIAAPPVAQTLHRLLGYRDGRWMHHAKSPLPVGALIVDEASMLDLELANAILDALPAGAPLVLVGDADQLPAIDAGQILADLAGMHGNGRVAVLETSHRQTGSGRAILDAASAVRAGHAHKLADKGPGGTGLATPRTPGSLTFRGVEWVDTAAAPRPLDAALAVATNLWHHFDGARALQLADTVFRFDGETHKVDPVQRQALEHLWLVLGRARILTVTRGHDTGSLAINQQLHGLALDRMTVAGKPDFVPGEPVMITANDYHRGLFNGDQGIVVRADEGLGGHRFRAVFRVGGELVPFAIEALRDRLELAWALTVHKSQGSELDAVAVILPLDDLPLVTRELVYTAVTRARHGVVVAGARPLLQAAGRRAALRDTGLAKRIAATLPP